MCSFPEPEANEIATSNPPERRGFNFSFISSLSCSKERDVLIWIVLYCLSVEIFVVFLFFNRMALSHSPLLIKAVSCPKFSLSSPKNATSSIIS